MEVIDESRLAGGGDAVHEVLIEESEIDHLLLQGIAIEVTVVEIFQDHLLEDLLGVGA